MATAAAMGREVQVREWYKRSIRDYVNTLKKQVAEGKMTWASAADDANRTRNSIMETARKFSSPAGRSKAQSLKPEGKSLETAIKEKTAKLYGEEAEFNSLSSMEKNNVLAEVVNGAAKSNLKQDAALLKLSKFGRGLFFVAICASVYTIYTSDDPVKATEHEAVVTGAGIVGAEVGGGAVMAGAAIGLEIGVFTGPAAPVFVVVGALIGGALAAFGADKYWH